MTDELMNELKRLMFRMGWSEALECVLGIAKGVVDEKGMDAFTYEEFVRSIQFATAVTAGAADIALEQIAAR